VQFYVKFNKVFIASETDTECTKNTRLKQSKIFDVGRSVHHHTIQID